MSRPLRLVVVGAAGRMGRALIRAVSEHQGCTLHAALEREHAPTIGQDAGILAGLPANGCALTHDVHAAFAGADGVLDFTTPLASVLFARVAAEHGLVHVIGTTGFNADEMTSLEEAAHRARIVQSGNFSLGVNLLAALVNKAAQVLGPDWDIELLEMHHKMKVDAPSGTALLLGEAAASGRNIRLEDAAVHTRDGHTGARKQGSIGFQSLRGGSVVGDHTVLFAGAGERIELRHIAEDRALFAQGALKAALWAQTQPPGLYDMQDVLVLYRILPSSS